jgi:vacuolar iron transporter family protein
MAILHHEKHFTSSDTVRDIVIGMADGLTVPFALAAGLAGAVSQTRLIFAAGVAEIVAGSIAMGLGGYLAARGDAEHYHHERDRENREVREQPSDEEAEIRDIFQEYGVDPAASTPVIESLRRQPEKWVDFMMRFELGLEKPDPKRATRSARNIAVSYVVGGLVPLASYAFITDAAEALRISVVLTIIALAVFGGVKGHFTGASPWKSSWQTVAVGGLAASAAFALARFAT